jgi:hypothetical protein
MDRRWLGGVYSAPSSPAHPSYSSGSNKKPTSKIKSMTNRLLAQKMTKAVQDYDDYGHGNGNGNGNGYAYGDKYGFGVGDRRSGFGAEKSAGHYTSPKVIENI